MDSTEKVRRNVVLPSELDQGFRRAVYERKGMEKGNLSDAMVDALEAWISGPRTPVPPELLSATMYNVDTNSRLPALIATRSHKGEPVVFHMALTSRNISLQRPKVQNVFQKPNPAASNDLGNYWILQEETPDRLHLGENEFTIYYGDIGSAMKVLKEMLDHDLDVPTLTPTSASPAYLERLGVDFATRSGLAAAGIGTARSSSKETAEPAQNRRRPRKSS